MRAGNVAITEIANIPEYNVTVSLPSYLSLNSNNSLAFSSSAIDS